MNQKIVELASQSGFSDLRMARGMNDYLTAEEQEKVLNDFANRIIGEHLHLLQNEWYRLNSEDLYNENDTEADIRYHKGKKVEVCVLLAKIRKHFQFQNCDGEEINRRYELHRSE